MLTEANPFTAASSGDIKQQIAVTIGIFISQLKKVFRCQRKDFIVFQLKMSSRDYFSKRCSQLYNDIDTQINQLSSCSLITLESNDIKSYKSGKKKITNIHIGNVIEAAKEFDAEIKHFVRKNAPKEKKEKVKRVCVKSTMPPIWNDGKLKNYIENVMNELEIPSPRSEHEMDTPRCQPKSILKKNAVKSEPKRNVGTNVKFLSPNTDQRLLQEQLNYKATTTEAIDKQKKDGTQCKKTQTIKTNDSETQSPTTSGTLFAHRYERALNDEKIVSKTNRPQSAPSKLVFAPIILTSTTESGKSDDIVMLADSSLATGCDNMQQMTKCLLPVLSIKRKCSIQRIYQLEILPTHDLHVNEESEASNVRFYECQYEPAAYNIADTEKSAKSSARVVVREDKKLNSTVFSQLSSTQIQHESFSTLNVPHVAPQPFERDEISATLSNLQTVLNEIKFNNGKINVVMKKPVERKRKFLKKKLRPNVSKKLQTKLDISQEEEHSTSSFSDEKVREFLGYEKKTVQTSTSNASGDPSSPPSAPIKNNSPETSLNNNFKSFYELFEKSFEASPSGEVCGDEVKENGVEKDLTRMREIIVLSEENIKKAGEILQKYQHVEQKVASTHDVSLQTSEIKLNADENLINRPENREPLKIDELSVLPAKVDSCVQTVSDKNMQTDGYKSRHYYKHVYDKFSNFNDINFDQPPLIKPHQSTATSSLIAKYLSDTGNNLVFNLPQFNIDCPQISPIQHVLCRQQRCHGYGE